MASQKYIDDPRILSRYLDDQLSDQERQEFEAYWAANPEVIEELEANARLQSGLAHLDRTGELGKLAQVRTTLRPVRVIALAASLFIAVASITFWLGKRDASAPLTMAASVSELDAGYEGKPPASEPVEILHVRSGQYDATIQLPDPPTALELNVLPDLPPAAAGFRAHLLLIGRGGSKTEIASVGELKAAENGFVTLYLNSAQLSPALYELRVSAEPDAGRVAVGEVDSFVISAVSSQLR